MVNQNLISMHSDSHGNIALSLYQRIECYNEGSNPYILRVWTFIEFVIKYQ